MLFHSLSGRNLSEWILDEIIFCACVSRYIDTSLMLCKIYFIASNWRYCSVDHFGGCQLSSPKRNDFGNCVFILTSDTSLHWGAKVAGWSNIHPCGVLLSCSLTLIHSWCSGLDVCPFLYPSLQLVALFLQSLTCFIIDDVVVFAHIVCPEWSVDLVKFLARILFCLISLSIYPNRLVWGGGGMNYLCLPMIKVGFSEGRRNIFLFLLEI